ncbi:L-rhamnose mutarotase [Microbulbifer sp. TB1203]|uniref:L-rhamnose mutarotase n=2 Tax=unclassified Microbulbifer TaxID=2619833 RepID=UPI0027E4250B|nr:L-rhamnose mutarotase [Microbulbifer sp. TB1203]
MRSLQAVTKKMKTQRYCLLLDLEDDPALIEEYKKYHQGVWPEIIQSIKGSGIEDMEIYLLGNRLTMIIEVNENFSFRQKAEMDAADPTVQKWEALMAQFQKPLPWAKKGEKWVKAECVFKLP